MNKICKSFLLILSLNFCRFQCAPPNYCPKYCQCDLYKNLNRADCSAQKLISSSIDIPKYVEILDLSENSITTLDNSCFEDFIHLLNLTLSYNNIHTIYLDAFSPLEKVQFIDLSNNRLEYFDQRIFENNKKLFSLNLSGNKFMSLPNKPLLKSASLQYLSLRNSQITHIYPNVFNEIPSLLKLDISDNLLITIKFEPFNQLIKLKFIDLKRNRWICDKNIETTVKIFKRKNIDVQLDKCRFDNRGSSVKMFERMIMMPKDTTSTTEQSETNVEFLWKNSNVFKNTNEEICSRNDGEEACRLYEKCHNSYKDLLNKTNSVENPYLTYFLRDLNITDFCMGFTIGVLITSLPILFVYIIKILCWRKRRRPYRNIITYQSRGRHQGRRTRRQQILPTTPPRIPPALNRSFSNPERRSRETNQENFASFISGLFERPRRERYYRAINQSTADVIRRLSRSNLLIGSRLSQHIGENRNSPQETEHLIETSSSEFENNRSRLDRVENMNFNRSETPPPAYKDVVSTGFI